MSIYFLRHGESKSNEQNRFAGRFDSPLTELGRSQAHRAAKEMKLLGIQIDELHVSPLTRARETAEITLQDLGITSSVTIIQSEELIERDFGALSEQNKSLIKKAYGHSLYEKMFHRADGAAPRGESFKEMYDRTCDYYYNVLLPSSQSGKTILVVAHKYIIEMFALIAAGMTPEQYFDFKIPNSKPSSFKELGKYAKNASPAAQASAEIIEIHLSKFLLIAACLGIMVKQIYVIEFESRFLINLVTGIFLAVNSFLSVLRLDSSVIKKSFSSLQESKIGILLRALTGLSILILFSHPISLIVGIYFLLPPAMTAPTLSLMWGGDYFFSAKLTGSLSIVSLVVLFLISFAAKSVGLNFPISFVSFFVLFVFSVLLPGCLAQGLRKETPIRAGAIATNQGWIGGAALIPLAFMSMYLLTPKVSSAFIEFERSHFWVEIAVVAAVLMMSRVLARIASQTCKIDEQSKFDVYLCQIFPNIFLLSSLLPASAHTGLILPLMNFTFFLSICLEEFRVVRKFALKQGLLSDPGNLVGKPIPTNY